MGELTMTSTRHRQDPTVPFENSDDLAYLHADTLPDRDFSDHLPSAVLPPDAPRNPRRPHTTPRLRTPAATAAPHSQRRPRPTSGSRGSSAAARHRRAQDLRS